MSVKNFFSGCEGEQHFTAAVEAGARYVLMSYLYLEKSGFDLIARRKQKYPKVNFLIDSGAHTFQSDKAKYSSWSLTNWEDYIQRYIKWLRQNKKYLFGAVELDVDWNVGTTVVESWQKRFFRPLLAEGIPIIFVWHRQRGIEGWEQMCSDFSWVGLPGEFSSEPDFNKYVTVARRYTTRIHGFAATKQADFRDYPWYSVDSTSWKAGEIYGTLIHWDKARHKLIVEQDKSRRALYRRYFEEYGLDADGIIADKNYRHVTKYALISMRQMELFYERLYASRTFYYELRLPHPLRIKNATERKLKRLWGLFRPEQLFRAHTPANLADLVCWLSAIAAVQYKERALLEANGAGLKFLQTYFPRMVPIIDMALFQKELANFIAPPNPPPQARTDSIHFVPTNQPKPRNPEVLNLEDLEWSPEDLLLNSAGLL